MELSEYTSALRKRWYVVLLATVLGGGLGLAQAMATEPAYRATAQVYVAPARGETVGDLVQGSTYAQKLVLSYTELATMPVVLEPVADRLGLDVSPRELARSVTVEAPLDTFIIRISASARSADDAAELADAVAAQLARTVSELSPGTAGPGVSLTTVSPADPPQIPYAPNTKLLTAVGLAIGLGLGVVAALAMALLDTRVRTVADIHRLTTLPVLAVIPYARSGEVSAATIRDDPASHRAEAYRRLQTNLRFIDTAGPVRTLVVSSAVPSEGKTTTALNLALAVAEKVQRVLLIDADLRRPSLAAQLGIEGSVGLTTVLIGMADLEDVVQPVAGGLGGLDVLASGEIPPNPAQLVDSSAMAALLEKASAQYDLVILDTPPLLPVADGAVLTRMTDGALVVAGCHRVRRAQVDGALESLETVGGTVLGIVATGVRTKGSIEEYTYESSAPRGSEQAHPGWGPAHAAQVRRVERDPARPGHGPSAAPEGHTDGRRRADATKFWDESVNPTAGR